MKLITRDAAIDTAAALIYAALLFFFAGLPLSKLPLNASLSLSIQPAVVVPIFVGLTAGPVGGMLVGLAGRLVGDLFAGQGLNGFGLLYSGLLGLVAGLGYGRLGGFRTLRQELIAFGWVVLACLAASLASTLLVQTLIWRDLSWTVGVNQTVSQWLSGAIIALLLISAPLYVWGRTVDR